MNLPDWLDPRHLDTLFVLCVLAIIVSRIWRWCWCTRDEADADGAIVPKPDVIDEALQANACFAEHFSWRHLPVRPARQLVVVTCMDARLGIEQALGLQPGDAHVIRNAGGIVTADTLRSLIVSHHLLGTQEIAIINHTQCGLQTFRDDELRARLVQATGKNAAEPAHFHAFDDLQDNVWCQIERVKAHPWLPRHMIVRGFIYDVRTGKLNEVSRPARPRSLVRNEFAT